MSSDHVRRRLIAVLGLRFATVQHRQNGERRSWESEWSSQQSASGGGVTVTTTTSFMGALSDGVIVPTIAHASTVSGFTGTTTISGGGNSTYSVTVR